MSAMSRRFSIGFIPLTIALLLATRAVNGFTISAIPATTSNRYSSATTLYAAMPESDPKHVETVLFVECGRYSNNIFTLVGWLVDVCVHATKG